MRARGGQAKNQMCSRAGAKFSFPCARLVISGLYLSSPSGQTLDFSHLLRSRISPSQNQACAAARSPPAPPRPRTPALALSHRRVSTLHSGSLVHLAIGAALPLVSSGASAGAAALHSHSQPPELVSALLPIVQSSSHRGSSPPSSW